MKDASPWIYFPDEFPNHFADYAHTILQSSGPVAHINPQDGDAGMEVLVANHSDVVEVIDVIEIDDDKTKAKADAYERAKRSLLQARVTCEIPRRPRTN